MLAQKLPVEARVFQKRTGLKLGKVRYQGDGDVYPLKNYPNRLVKIVPHYNNRLKKVLEILKYLQESKSPAVVKIHRIGHFTAPYYDNKKQEFYYYIMDKLALLPRNNRSSLVNKIANALFDNNLDPKAPTKVKVFVNQARKLKYEYADIHEGNILRGKGGALKFIDLESFMFQEIL